MTWELKAARDLRINRTFVVRGDYHASARKVTGPPVIGDDAVTLTAAPLWDRWAPGETPVSLVPETPVYILNCTCNGMGFICNQWVFTGECRCRHHPLPTDNG